MILRALESFDTVRDRQAVMEDNRVPINGTNADGSEELVEEFTCWICKHRLAPMTGHRTPTMLRTRLSRSSDQCEKQQEPHSGFPRRI
jgi:hypothetical protein